MPSIDIGQCWDAGDSGSVAGITRISTYNAANATGSLTSISVWFMSSGANVKAGTFYNTSGSNFTNRDYEVLGSVASGSMQTFSGLNCSVTTGDLIGLAATSGLTSLSASAGTYHHWSYSADTFGGGSYSYTDVADQFLSIAGSGATLAIESTITAQTGSKAQFSTAGSTYNAAREFKPGVKAEFDGRLLDGRISGASGIKLEIDGQLYSGQPIFQSGIHADFEGMRLADTLEAKTGLHATFAGTLYSGKLDSAFGVRASFTGELLDGKMSPAFGVNATFDGAVFSAVIAAAAGISAEMTGGRQIAVSIAQQFAVHADFAGFNWTEFLRACKERISIRYTLTLTGGTGPIIIPIFSFQGRFRTGDPSFLAVTVPGNDQYDDIALRSAGDLILTMQYLLDGVVFYSEVLITVDLEEIRLDEGSSSATVTLSGHRTITHSPKRVTLTGASYKAFDGTKYRYRCTPDLYLRPGDTCTINGDTITAGLITWYANPDSMTMEIQEA